MIKQWFSAAEIAGLPSMPGTERRVRSKADRESWNKQSRKGKGGGFEYELSSLPPITQAALLKKYSATIKQTEDEPPAAFKYDNEELWRWAELQTHHKRDIGAHRAELLRQVMRLVDTGYKFRQAAELVGTMHDVSPANLRNWYYGVNHKPGAQHYKEIDWPAALIPGHRGKTIKADIHPSAWDWFIKHWLTRRQPTISDSYRRLEEVAKKQGWNIPSERTFQRRIKAELSEFTIVLMREGPEALNKLYPPMQRDKTCFTAGEAVSGDGIKFDKLWIDWGDEIINTTTAWVWQDIYSNKLLAHRVAKTENTDLFRLATYDLLAICKPSYTQIDNTRVAANKAMTGKTNTRYRFHNKANDNIGMLVQLGMGPRFTSPDHTISNPGVKPIERAFGIGGIHSEVTTHPKLINRGFSKETAIPIDEFRAVLAEEIKRFNARPKRRTDICRGIISFDDAFNQSFATSQVTRVTEAQRRLLLLMVEVVKPNRTNGAISIKAGASRLGKNRYWSEELSKYKGVELAAYYDPENLQADISVFTLDGKFITNAEHKGGVAFNDTVTGREHAKQKQRFLKAQKVAAVAETRMNQMEHATLYPEPEDVHIPEPGIVKGNFGQKRQVTESGEIVENTLPRAVGDDSEMQEIFRDNLRALKIKHNRESLNFIEDDE